MENSSTGSSGGRNLEEVPQELLDLGTVSYCMMKMRI